MEKTIVKTGKTVEEAKAAALEELGVSEDQATIEVINESEGGFLGMGKQAEVKVTANVEEASEEEEVVYYGDDENFEGDAVSEAEDAAVQFVAEVLSGIGIHGNMDSYRERTPLERCSRNRLPEKVRSHRSRLLLLRLQQRSEQVTFPVSSQH